MTTKPVNIWYDHVTAMRIFRLVYIETDRFAIDM